MAKKKPNPELDTRPARMEDFTPTGRKAARAIVTDFGDNLGNTLRAQGAAKRRQATNARAKGGKAADNARTYDAAAKRMEESAPVVDRMKRRRTTVEGMAANNVEAVELAATSHRMPPSRHPQSGKEGLQESLGGTGWYLHANQGVSSEIPAGFPKDKAVAATSTLSQGTKPEDERASMGALSHAVHSGATVKMTPAVHAHLAHHGGAPYTLGTEVPFRDLDPRHASALADPAIRSHMEQHSPDVAWTEIARAASHENRTKALAVLTGATPVEQAQNPSTAPKTNTYTRNIALASSDTPNHAAVAGEYLMRGAHVGDLIRGDIPNGQRVGEYTHPDDLHLRTRGAAGPARPAQRLTGTQEMLDLFGKRGSQEGILNPRLSTPQDSWQMGIHNVGVSEPSVIKVSGDVTPGSKTHQGTTVSPDARVTPANVAHAVHDEATMRAAAILTRRFRPGYEVPSQLVQETGWTGARRLAGGDAEYNAAVREQGRVSKESAAADPPVTKRTSRVFLDGHEQKASQMQLPKGRDVPNPAQAHLDAAHDQVWTAGHEARHQATVAKRRREGRALPVDPEARAAGW